MTEYGPILILGGVGTVLALLIPTLSFLLGHPRKVDPEKISAYECGFDPFESSRIPFSVRFFLIGILFMIFDLEISFIFP